MDLGPGRAERSAGRYFGGSGKEKLAQSSGPVAVSRRPQGTLLAPTSAGRQKVESGASRAAPEQHRRGNPGRRNGLSLPQMSGHTHAQYISLFPMRPALQGRKNAPAIHASSGGRIFL